MSSVDGLDFVAVDMETATAQRSSVCAVGIALVRAGEVVATETVLVQPPTGVDSFSAVNRGIHGLCAEDVRDAPEWGEVADRLEALGFQLPLVAHNAAFDRGVYEAACAAVGRPAQAMQWRDLLALSRRLRPDLTQHTLPVLAEAYGVQLENHHDAEQDARASAEVLIAIAQEQGVQRIDDLWPEAGSATAAEPVAPAKPADELQRSPVAEPETPARERGEDDPNRQEWFSRAARTKVADLPKPAAGADPAHPLHGEHVVISGSVQGWDRYGLWERIAAVGGHPQKNVTKKTTVLVAGNFEDVTRLASGDVPLGTKMTSKERKAAEYAAAGQSIRAMTAAAFLKALAGAEPGDGVAVLGRAPVQDRALTTPEPEGASVPAASNGRHTPSRPTPVAEPEASARPADDRSAYMPAALRRSHFDDDGPRPWERPAPDRDERPERGHYPVDGGASQAGVPARGGSSSGVARLAKKAAGAVMTLVALAGVVFTVAGISVVLDYIAVGHTSGVVVGVGMTAVCGLLTAWLGVKGLRWMRG